MIKKRKEKRSFCLRESKLMSVGAPSIKLCRKKKKKIQKYLIM